MKAGKVLLNRCYGRGAKGVLCVIRYKVAVKWVVIVLIFAGTATMPATARAKTVAQANSLGWCKKAGAASAGIGATVSTAGAAANAVGVAAVAHSSGAAILTSVGVGGTGYVAGTVGGAAATALAFVSSPAVIVGAAAVTVVGAGVYGYCRLRR